LLDRGCGEPARRSKHLVGAQLLELLLGLTQPSDQRLDAVGQLLARGLQLLRQLRDEHRLTGQEAVGVGADERFDPAGARTDRRLAEQLDDAEMPGAPGVGAAAELSCPVADRDDAHPVAVLLAEQRHGSRCDGLGL
jgi:hypothetical protein